MATFTVAAGTDWIGTIVFGSSADRWRLDDYDLIAHLKVPGGDQILIEMTLDNGRLVITDPLTRRLEINVGWADMAALEATLFEFDVLFINRSTDVRSRSEIFTLEITRGITEES